MHTKKSNTNKTRIVAIDYGIARLGLAVSDETKLIATPLPTLRAEKKIDDTLGKLLEMLNQHQQEFGYTIAEIVVGLPLMMSGRYGPLADEVKHFVETLRKAVSFPITTWDERLTSVQADRSLRESQMSRKKRAQNVDSVAALIILQNYLDHKSFQR